MAYANSSGGTRPGRSAVQMTRSAGSSNVAGNARGGFRSAGAVSPLRQVTAAPASSASMAARGVPRVGPGAARAPSTTDVAARAIGTNLASQAVTKGGKAAYRAATAPGLEGNNIALADVPQTGGGYYNFETGAQTLPVTDTTAGVIATPLGDTAGQAADFNAADSYSFSDAAANNADLAGSADAVEGGSTAAGATDASAAGASNTVPLVGAAVRAANSDPRGAAGSATGGYVGGIVGTYFGMPGVGAAVGSFVGANVADPLSNEGERFANRVSGEHLANVGDPYGQYFNGNDTGERFVDINTDFSLGPIGASARDNGFGEDAKEFSDFLAFDNSDFADDIGDQQDAFLGSGGANAGQTAGVENSQIAMAMGVPTPGAIEQATSGCFITEATMSGLGVDDDEAEPLQVLRFFRDKVMMGTPQGQAMVEEYEAIAPLVVEAVETRPDALEIFKKLFTDFIAPSVEAVKTNNYAQALQIYAAMIDAVTPYAQAMIDMDEPLEQLADHAAVVAGNTPQATGLRQFIGGM